jgi:hypothetical protein
MNDFFLRSEWIGKFTDKELDREQENSLLHMASQNPLLRNELRMDREINEMFMDMKKAELSEMIHKTIHKKKKMRFNSAWLKIAASVVVLVTLSILASLIILRPLSKTENNITYRKAFRKQTEPGLLGFLPDIKPVYEKAAPVKHRKLAQLQENTGNYTPRPEYEFLVGAITRDQTVFILSPQARVQCKQDSSVTFNWKWLSECTPLSIVIISNKGETIFVSEPLTNVPFFLQTRHWQKGLYYYKITNKDDLVTMGSISIK